MLISTFDCSGQSPFKFKATVSVLAGAIMGCVWAAPAFSAPPEKSWKEGRILVQPKAGLSDYEFDKILRKNKGRALGKLKDLDVHIIEVAPQAELAVARALSNNRHIKFAEVDMAVAPSLVPNDPKFSSAWHLPKMRITEAWPIALGNDVTVAVLDTGVDASHLDLQRNMVAGRNAASNSADTSDVHGHGTKVAGTVAAESNNSLGVSSVAWNTKIMPVRITNSSDGYAYFSDIAAGLTWAANNGADVANISYSVSGSSTVTSAAQYMRNKGGVVVVAAGNTGDDPGYAPNPYMISVSATASSDTRTSWSSYGDYVDFAAPGSGIWTTVKGGSYSAVSGTSFASPVTAGVVALMKSANPSLSPAEIEAILQGTAVDLGNMDWDPYYGFGRIDAFEAVTTAADAGPSDTVPPSVSISSPSSGGSVTGLVPVSVEATDDFGVAKVELYVDGLQVGTDTTKPFGFSWNSENRQDGNASLVARAFDLSGNQGSSSAVTVVVQNAAENDAGDPQVSITSPSDGEDVSGNVGLSAFATDDQRVSMVNLYVDGKLKCSGAPTVSCNWNTRKAEAGSHTISAKATDSAGNSTNTSINVNLVSGSTKSGNKGKGSKK